MSAASDARFWDRTARKYAARAITDQAGYDRLLDRTRAWLGSDDRVLELGCGTGMTALQLVGDVRSYLATDISTEMIAIAREKHAASPLPALVLRVATAEALIPHAVPFDAILGFNYLHLVRDLPGTLRSIHGLLAAKGVLISQTPCLADMNPLVRFALLPAMRMIGKAPYAGAFRTVELSQNLSSAGFDILTVESLATKSAEDCPYIVARKK